MGMEAGRLDFLRRQRARHQRIGEHRHQALVELRMQLAGGVAASRHAHRARLDHATRRRQIVHAIAGLPALHRACRVHLDAQAARLAQIAEGQLARVHADAFRLVHRTAGLFITDPLIAHRGAIDDAGIVVEGLAQQARFLLQPRHHALAVGDIQMAARLRIAVDVLDQFLEILHALDALAVQAVGGLEAVTLDPLRALEAAGGALRLTAIAGRTAPADPIGLQHGGLDAVLLGQHDGGGQPREAGADDHHIGVDIAHHRAIVCRRLTGGGDPVGRRVVAPFARGGAHQRVVGRVIGPRGLSGRALL